MYFALSHQGVGRDSKRCMAHKVIEVIDILNVNEKPYSIWQLSIVSADEAKRFGLIEGDIGVIGMIRRGREHQRERHHIDGQRELVVQYLAALPRLTQQRRNENQLPREIALVLNADVFTVEEVADIYRDLYEIDSKNVDTFIRAYVDYNSFIKADIPFVPASVEINSINYQRIKKSRHAERILQSIRNFYKEIQGDAFSYKTRSIRTPGAYFDARDRFSRRRLGIGGILAQDTTNPIMPIAMGGDLVVSKEARNQGIGLALRWSTYASVFYSHPRFIHGIITSYYSEKNQASRKIIVEHLNGKEVSRSLWVVLKRKDLFDI